MSNRTLGIILIIAGLAIYLANIGVFSGDMFLVAIGAGFLAAYFFINRRIGFLIAGSVIVALGAFAVLEQNLPGDDHGYLFFLFMAMAFANVYLVELATGGGAIWALYPAGFLGLFSAFVFLAETDSPLIHSVFSWWPLIIIGAGLWLLFGGRRTDKSRQN